MPSSQHPQSRRILHASHVSLIPLPSFFVQFYDSEVALLAAKFLCILTLAMILCALALLNLKDVLRSRSQFKNWYNQYSYQFRYIARDNCTAEYSIYLYGTRQNTSNPTLSAAGDFTLFVQPMINCLLENSSEYVKYQMSTSKVLLGITPTIIALLGSSSEEVCFLALVGRRRLLGLLLAMASPSIYTQRAFKYQDPDEIFKERLNKNHVKLSTCSKWRWLLVSLEYMLLFIAIANIAALNWPWIEIYQHRQPKFGLHAYDVVVARGYCTLMWCGGVPHESTTAG